MQRANTLTKKSLRLFNKILGNRIVEMVEDPSTKKGTILEKALDRCIAEHRRHVQQVHFHNQAIIKLTLLSFAGPTLEVHLSQIGQF